MSFRYLSSFPLLPGLTWRDPVMPPSNDGCILRSVDITTSQPHAANLSHLSQHIVATLLGVRPGVFSMFQTLRALP